MNNIGLTTILLAAVILPSCAIHQPSGTTGGGSIVRDGGPDRDLDVSHINDAVPRVEARTRAGNSNPYTVLGKTYRLVDDTTGFRQTGDASWYGTKFHGRLTANGEVYDMYGMTAAHKTLPIPSYVRVTNKLNGKSVVVRINDRGPFHGNRIIDLTYTAAKKLDFVKRGTAPVEVEYLEMRDPPKATQLAELDTSREWGDTAAPAPEDSAGYALPPNTFLQVGAFGTKSAALRAKQILAELTDYPVFVRTAEVDELLRVQVGPFRNNLDMMNLRQKLLDAKFSEPHVVYD